MELRAGLLFCERLAGGDPLLLLGDLTEAAVGRFLDDAALRSRVAVYDLVRLEKVNTVRCSIFVHFEWFLRDTYGVKILPAADFTQGLIDRGVISASGSRSRRKAAPSQGRGRSGMAPARRRAPERVTVSASRTPAKATINHKVASNVPLRSRKAPRTTGARALTV